MIKIILIFIALYFSTNLKADQNSPNLESLFNELFQEKNITKQNIIVSKIWDEWMQSDNSDVQIIMNNIPSYFQSKNYKEAISALSFVIELEPSFSEAYNKRATFYFMMGEYEKSMQDIEFTLSLEPRHFGALDGMSLIFIHTNQPEKAIDVYDKMLEIFPNSTGTKIKKEKMLSLSTKST